MLDPNLVVSETKFWEAAVSIAEQRFHKLCDEAEAMSIQGYLSARWHGGVLEPCLGDDLRL